jgi:hypothetical protein
MITEISADYKDVTKDVMKGSAVWRLGRPLTDADG